MTYPAETFVITLYTPVKDPAGADVFTLTMREPRVSDRIMRAYQKGTEEENEVTTIATLCDVPREVITALTVADYAQLQEQLAVFMVPPADRPAARLKLAEMKQSLLEDSMSGIYNA